MTRDFEKSTLSLAILGLVSLNPASGYDLRKIFIATPMGHFSTSPGAVYPALKRMEKRGLIKGTVEKKNTLRPRQTFTITKKGLMFLKEILSQPIAAEDVKWNLDELILRFAFMGKIVGQKRSVRFLGELVLQTQAYIFSLEKHLGENRDKMMATARYALEHGIVKYRATLHWARQVISEIEPG